MQLLLLLVAFLLPPRAGAGEIIGGQEARPHSHPYMAYILIQTPRGLSTCGGFLVREDFVMTAARCNGSRIRVILGAHNIRREERTQQRLSVLRAIRHPQYDPQNNLNDIMLLQLENNARRNRFVRPVALPQTRVRLNPGASCTVAGWGLVSLHRRTHRLQEVRLRVQSDEECMEHFGVYNGQRQICVGDQRERKITFLVRPPASANTAQNRGAWAEVGSGKSLHPTASVWGPDQSMVGAFSHQSSLWWNERSSRHTMHTYAVFSCKR
ncbi:cathepsin G-like [Pteropus medius]|uniref:cathepsin G-like n=1 Tax=Pteropus vampyrus TaxID=132908 RepID=UPI00196A245E|nr:cathepsin G-like [Pteropus giganteus]